MFFSLNFESTVLDGQTRKEKKTVQCYADRRVGLSKATTPKWALATWFVDPAFFFFCCEICQTNGVSYLLFFGLFSCLALYTNSIYSTSGLLGLC